MHHRATLLRAVAAAAFSLIIASAVFAQPSRTFVASTGNDANPCSRALPCRNFGAAVSAVASGGEVVVLDSAGYGPVSIFKGVSIISPPGVYAGVAFPTPGTAIFVNAPGALVRLRGLSLNGFLAGGGGVRGLAFGQLRIESCDLTGFTVGVFVDGGGSVTIDDTVVRDGGEAVEMTPPASAPVIATIQRSRFVNNPSGNVVLDSRAVAGSAIVIRDSSMTDSSSVGAAAYAALMNVENCLLSNLFAAVTSNSAAVVNVSRSTIVDSATALYNGDGTLNSYQNNELNGNGADTAGTITNVTTK